MVGWMVLAAEPASPGQICVAPLPENVEALDRDMPRGVPQRREAQYQFSVAVDNLAPVMVPTGSMPRLITDVAVGSRHLIVIRDGREVIESFDFTFEERGSAELCLQYTPWYQTWQLEPPRRGARWCRCGPRVE